MSSKVWSRIITFLIIFNIISFVWQNRESYLQKYDYVYWQYRFDQSQYAQGDKSSYILSDSELNTLRGYLYVEKGIDMEKFIPGHPPLASYLLGISIAIFNNQYIASLIIGVVSLFFLYKICILLTGIKFMSLVITLLFSLEPIFRSQLNDSMLDIFQMCFGLIAAYYFLVWIKYNRIIGLILSQIFIGFVLSTKFVLSGAPLPMALAISTILLNNFQKFKKYIFTLPLIAIGYLIGHITYFFYHISLVSFIKYQRYIIDWWFGSAQTPPFQVWDMIFFNRWHTWWGNMDVVSIDIWRITWPTVFLLSLLSLLLIIFRRLNSKYIIPLYLWLIISLLLYSFATVYPRHLLYIFPVAYILASLAIINLTCPKCKLLN
jgi:hypothetical protein